MSYCAFGLVPVVRASFTLEPGGHPSVAILRSTLNVPPPYSADLIFKFGGAIYTFPGCRLFKTNREERIGPPPGYYGEGEYWVHVVKDRRWMWEEVRVKADWNIRVGTSVRKERRPKEIATALFAAIGESDYDISAMPDDDRPEVHWDETSVADAFDELCEKAHCRLVLTANNSVRIVPLVVPIPLAGDTINPPTPIPIPAPGKVTLVCKPTLYEHWCLLEPVIYAGRKNFFSGADRVNLGYVKEPEPMRTVLSHMLGTDTRHGYVGLDPFNFYKTNESGLHNSNYDPTFFRYWRTLEHRGLNPYMPQHGGDWPISGNQIGTWVVPRRGETPQLLPYSRIFLKKRLANGEGPYVQGTIMSQMWVIGPWADRQSPDVFRHNISPMMHAVQITDDNLIHTDAPLFAISPHGYPIDPLLALRAAYNAVDEGGAWYRETFSRDVSNAPGELRVFSELGLIMGSQEGNLIPPWTNQMGPINFHILFQQANAELDRIIAREIGFNAYEIRYAGLMPFYPNEQIDYMRWETSSTYPCSTLVGYRNGRWVIA